MTLICIKNHRQAPGAAAPGACLAGADESGGPMLLDPPRNGLLYSEIVFDRRAYAPLKDQESPQSFFRSVTPTPARIRAATPTTDALTTEAQPDFFSSPAPVVVADATSDWLLLAAG